MIVLRSRCAMKQTKQALALSLNLETGELAAHIPEFLAKALVGKQWLTRLNRFLAGAVVVCKFPAHRMLQRLLDLSVGELIGLAGAIENQPDLFVRALGPAQKSQEPFCAPQREHFGR